MADLELRKVFAANLRDQLNMHGMTQFELSKRLGTGSATVTDWMKLRSMPRSNMLKKLTEIFSCQMSDLLSPAEDRPGQIDNELTEYLEMLRTRPECRMLFSLTKDATKEDVEKAVAIITALRSTEGK